jgi:hypothetical protein
MAELSVLNPVSIKREIKFTHANRLDSLNGKKIALVWNGKAGGDILLKYTAELLSEKYPNMNFEFILGDAGSMMRHLTPKQVNRIAKECVGVIGSTAD